MPGSQATAQIHQGSEVHLAVAQGEPQLEGKQALKTLLTANKRLNTAYSSKETFGQLWGYEPNLGSKVFRNDGAQSGNGSNPTKSSQR